ncbi:MAG: DivIVA domain-containing protein [Tepidanaerobacteraceae bacterium]|nr:DivIVA domain-containing protein [Tepidanaerobacter sp.]HQA60764.1 DivIVA domain-containing protein [Tepidanaerobacteraceae bacterium]HQE04955.1 DivIVA domain-containing protein [Tepidanaerobacteraceae bacterium]
MDISPLEIQKKEFSRSIRGYNTEEVDEFLDNLLANYERIYKENRDLREQIQLLHEKMQSYKDIETTMKNALVLAEKTAEEVKSNAEREKEAILKEARLHAKEIIQQAKEQFNQINNQNEELRQQFCLYKIRFKNFLESQLEYLDSLELDLFADSASSCESALKAAAASDGEENRQDTDREVHNQQ